MIVKIQLPPSGEPTALVYNESQSFMTEMPLTPEIKARMGLGLKKFFRAQFKMTTMVLEEEVMDPGW